MEIQLHSMYKILHSWIVHSFFILVYLRYFSFLWGITALFLFFASMKRKTCTKSSFIRVKTCSLFVLDNLVIEFDSQAYFYHLFEFNYSYYSKYPNLLGVYLVTNHNMRVSISIKCLKFLNEFLYLMFAVYIRTWRNFVTFSKVSNVWCSSNKIISKF